MTLRRTVPFVAHSTENSPERVLLIDKVEATLAAAANPALIARLRRSLDLGEKTSCVSAAEAERTVLDQYDACLEYIFSHPIWERIRRGEAHRELRGHLLETRHYLSAAPFRMASGVAANLRADQLNALQAHPVIEEADHDRFFENALVALGCPPALIRQARPSPVTLEWIHPMRKVASYGPLAAALCSGLLETTTRERAVVAWHRLLVDLGVLPKEAAEAIFEHVRVDFGLGHGENWRQAVHAAGVVTFAELAEGLNAVTVVAEMMVRCLDALETGLCGEVVQVAPSLRLDRENGRHLGVECRGQPVWPAEIYDSVVHGPRHNTPGIRRAAAYAFSGAAHDVEPGTGHAAPARDLVRSLPSTPPSSTQASISRSS
jgi:hypothetical protein